MMHPISGRICPKWDVIQVGLGRAKVQIDAKTCLFGVKAYLLIPIAVYGNSATSLAQDSVRPQGWGLGAKEESDN
jgi:hypothetical protein